MINSEIIESDFLKLRDFDIIKDGERLLLKESNNFIISISGKYINNLIPRLLPMLDGNTPVHDILFSMKDVNRKVIISVLEKLVKYDIVDVIHLDRKCELSENEKDRYRSQLKFFSYKRSEDSYSQQIRLKNAKVNIISDEVFLIPMMKNMVNSGIGEIRYFYNEDIYSSVNKTTLEEFNKSASEIIGENLNSCDVEKIFEKKTDFIVVADRNFTKAEKIKINKKAVQKNVPWMTFSDFGEKETIIGPLIVPYKTPCFKCYQLRRESNYSFLPEIRLFNKRKEIIYTKRELSKGYLFPLIDTISGLVSLEVIKYLTQFVTPISLGKIYIINWLTMDTEVHSVLKIPRCPECGVKEYTPFALWKEPAKE